MIPKSLPGSRSKFTLCHWWKDPDDTRNQASPLGSAGFYSVTFILGRSSGTLAGDLQPNEIGDSFIIIAHAGTTPNPGVPYAGVEYGAGDEKIHFDLYVNAQSRLARMITPKVYAMTFADAEAKCSRAVHGLLSQLTVRFNVPLHVAKMDIREIATENHSFLVVMPYDNAQFDAELNLAPSADFIFYASLYREALNSNSAAYKFLCFYKIVEGLRTRRNRIASARKNLGEDVERFTEVVPTEASERKAWLTDLFDTRSSWGEDDNRSIIPEEAAGKKFGRVIHNYLHPIRLGIAHGVLDTGEATLKADDMLHMDRVYRWLGITQCIARQMLKNDFPEDFKNRTSAT